MSGCDCRKNVFFFVYIHASGPGHGDKNYNRVTTRRLIVYSFPLIIIIIIIIIIYLIRRSSKS